MSDLEQNPQQAIKVRQVTQIHANWNEETRGEEGKFSFQLILDNGAEEYVIPPDERGRRRNHRHDRADRHPVLRY